MSSQLTHCLAILVLNSCLRAILRDIKTISVRLMSSDMVASRFAKMHGKVQKAFHSMLTIKDLLYNFFSKCMEFFFIAIDFVHWVWDSFKFFSLSHDYMTMRHGNRRDSKHYKRIKEKSKFEQDEAAWSFIFEWIIALTLLGAFVVHRYFHGHDHPLGQDAFYFANMAIIPIVLFEILLFISG